MFYQSDSLQNKPEIGKKTLGEGLYLHPAGVDRSFTSKDSFILLGSGEQANTGIGGSLDWMIWSEAALTKDAETHWTTISPSMKGALFDVAESTPSLVGQDSIIFPEFENPTEGCDREFISWMDVTEYRLDDPILEKDFSPYVDHNLYGKEAEVMTEYKVSIPQMLWRRFKLDELKNLNAFRQVFPISQQEAFFSAAGLFFHKSYIDMTKPKVKIEPKSAIFADQGRDVSIIYDYAGPWKIYHDLDISQKYIIICDVSEGKYADKEQRDPDYSVVGVFRLRNPIEEVAFFRERIPPEVLAEQVAVVARYYSNAFVVPERNGPGLAFLIRLLQIYKNVYRQQKLSGGSYVMTEDYGFLSTGPSKVHALSCLLSRIRDESKGLILRTEIFRHEMSKFVQNKMSFSALPGFHDDTVAILWILALCIEQTPSLLLKRDLDGQLEQVMRTFEPTIRRENKWQFTGFNPNAYR